jgi:hypothetical protein
MSRLLRAALALVIVAGCYPDADEIRHTQGPVVGPDSGAADAPDDGPLPSGADSGSEAGSLLSPDAAGNTCVDFGAAWCEKARRCGDLAYELQGGAGTCAARLQLWCTTNLQQPSDTAFTPDVFRSCIAGWETLSCDRWLDDEPATLRGPNCAVAGKRADGAGCWNFAQCQSLTCSIAEACGTCVQPVANGGACQERAECQRGSSCNMNHKCVAPGALGGSCDPNRPCRASLFCLGGLCRPKQPEGGNCVRHDDCALGLFCNSVRNACGRGVPSTTHWDFGVPDGTVLYCAGGRVFEPDGTCRPLATEHEPCVDSNHCLWPAFCGVAGQCEVPTPTDCPVTPGP